MEENREMNPGELRELLKDAYDIHIHCAPDLIPRSQDVHALAEDAHKAGMAGIGLKDHTAPTFGHAYILNKLYPEGPHFYSAITLNPPSGGLNPAAVEAALRSGTDIVYFPSYSAKRNLETLAAKGLSNSMPVNGKGFEGICILDKNGRLKSQVIRILELIYKFDAVLATGHLSPGECITLLKAAAKSGIKRMVATHASQPAPGMSVDDQREAAACGAFIEHSFLAVTNGIPDPVPLEVIRDQIRSVGVEKVILSSDFGKASLMKPVQGFAHYLKKMLELGFTKEEIEVMVSRNPAALLGGRKVK